MSVVHASFGRLFHALGLADTAKVRCNLNLLTSEKTVLDDIRRFMTQEHPQTEIQAYWNDCRYYYILYKIQNNSVGTYSLQPKTLILLFLLSQNTGPQDYSEGKTSNRTEQHKWQLVTTWLSVIRFSQLVLPRVDKITEVFAKVIGWKLRRFSLDNLLHLEENRFPLGVRMLSSCKLYLITSEKCTGHTI